MPLGNFDAAWLQHLRPVRHTRLPGPAADFDLPNHDVGRQSSTTEDGEEDGVVLDLIRFGMEEEWLIPDGAGTRATLCAVFSDRFTLLQETDSDVNI